jgi:hypothetical protein
MRLPRQTAKRIEEAMADLPEEPRLHVDAVAKRHGGIPLLAGLVNVILLRSDGSLVEVEDCESDDPPRPVSGKLETLALASGTERFTWLSELLPTRPPGAEDCPSCAGAGRLRVRPANRGTVVCSACTGLGWTP